MEKSVGATSGKVRNHISDDLAFSILSKLPLKSLKRFGCVRKSWALLLENPYFMGIFHKNFISNHHSYYEDTFLLLHYAVYRPDFYCSLYSLSGERFENRVKLDWPNPFQQDDPFFFYTLDSGSIAGTLCLYASDDRVVLWNPATEEFKVVPLSPYESAPPYWVPYVILHGFGYEHITDDYKLIRYVYFFPQSGPELDGVDVPLNTLNLSCDCLWEIYSVRSNSWRKLDANIPRYHCCIAGERLYMDEMCHWWGFSDNDEHWSVSFNLGNEVFFTTPIPLGIDYGSDFNFLLRYLGVLSGSIALISWYQETTTFHISILGELGVKESWTKLFIVEPLPCVQRPIGVGKKGDIFFINEDGELIWFDLSTEVIEELGVKGEPSCHIVIYKESLLPIEGINH